MEPRHIRMLATVLVAVAIAWSGYRWVARRADLAAHREIAAGYAVSVDPAGGVVRLRRPDGRTDSAPLHDAVSLGLYTRSHRPDGEDGPYWTIEIGPYIHAFDIPYLTMPTRTLLDALAPTMPGLDVESAEQMAARFERERDLYCRVWVSPRYQAIRGMGPPPTAECRPYDPDADD